MQFFSQPAKPVSVSMLEREHLTVKWPQVTVENELQVAAFYVWRNKQVSKNLKILTLMKFILMQCLHAFKGGKTDVALITVVQGTICDHLTTVTSASQLVDVKNSHHQQL